MPRYLRALMRGCPYAQTIETVTKLYSRVQLIAGLTVAVGATLLIAHRVDIERPRYGESISRSPESRRCALSGCLLLRTGHCNKVPRWYYRPSIEQYFLSCSFGGRPGRKAHQALTALHERIADGKSAPGEKTWVYSFTNLLGGTHLY